ncbi:AAA family ATPase [Nocardia gipuzkoensis]
MSDQVGGDRRLLYVVAARDYPDADPHFAAGIDEQLDVVRDWWCHTDLQERSFTASCSTAIKSRDDVESLVRDLRLRHLATEDVAVLYITGHGREASSGRHYLILPETPDDEFAVHAYPTAEMVTAIIGSHAQHVLVIVNTCYSGALNDELATLRRGLSASRRKLRSLHVFTIGDFDERPRILDFTRVLAHVHGKLKDTGQYADSHLSVDDFRRELDSAAPSVARLVYGGEFPNPEPSPCLPNPGYRAPDRIVASARRQVADSRAEVDYWLDRASGRVTAEDPGWYFAGRRNLTSQVAEFLRSGTGLLIVTGTYGTGKSAVIARAVTLSDPAFRDDPRYAEAVSTAPDDTMPPSGSVDIAILARQKTAADILDQIVEAAGVNLPGAIDSSSRTAVLRSLLKDHVAALGRTLTIVLDGLDEAKQPMLLIPEVVSPLAGWRDAHGAQAIRLIVGVRSEATSSAVSSVGDTLLNELRRAATHVNELRTDTSNLHEDIAAYIEALLVGAAAEIYRTMRSARHEVASVVAQHVGMSFLDARLAGERLRRRAEPQRLDDTEWLRSLSDGTVGLLSRDLLEAATADHGVAELLAMLRAAAFAGGGGVPLGEVWAAMTAAVLDRDPAPGALNHLLGGRLIGYLTRDIDDGVVVFRPVHERLRELLRSEPLALQMNRSSIVGPSSSEVAVHAEVCERLRRMLPTDVDIPPHPYTRRELVTHAALGYVLDDAHVPTTFLRWESSGDVRGHVGIPAQPEFQGTTLAVWAGLEPFVADMSPTSRALSLDIALTSAEPTESRSPAVDILARPRWSRWMVKSNVLAASGVASAIAVVPMQDGRILLATGGGDMVRLWDSATGRAIGTPMAGSTNSAAGALTALLVEGRTLLASGGTDGVVRLWDPMTSHLVDNIRPGLYSSFTGFASVTALASVSLPDGRELLAIGSVDGMVTVWDPVARHEVWQRELLDSIRNLLAVPLPDGRIVLCATPNSHGVFHLLDVTTGNPLRSHGVRRTADPVSVMAVLVLSGGRVLIATTSYGDRTIALRDPVTGRVTGTRLSGHTNNILAMAAVPFPDGRVLLASASEDCTVRLWNPLTGRQVGDSLTGHTHWVESVAAASEPTGRVLVVSGSIDGTLRVWDPHDLLPFNDELSRRAESVYAATTLRLGDGRLLFATGDDRSLQLWDPETGRQVGKSMIGHTTAVLAATALPLNDRHVLLASGGGAAVLLWDPMTGQSVGAPLTGHRGEVVALTSVPCADGRTLLASGSAGEGDVRLWDPLTGQLVRVLKIGGGNIGTLTAIPGPDGRTMLVTGSSTGTVRLWDPMTGRPVGEPLLGHTKWIADAKPLSLPDGRILLATGSDDGTARLWNPALGEMVGEPLSGHAGRVWAVAPLAMSDGRVLIATGGSDATVRLWDVSAGRVVRVAALGAAVRRMAVIPASATGPARLMVAGDAGILVLEIY